MMMRIPTLLMNLRVMMNRGLFYWSKDTNTLTVIVYPLGNFLITTC